MLLQTSSTFQKLMNEIFIRMPNNCEKKRMQNPNVVLIISLGNAHSAHLYFSYFSFPSMRVICKEGRFLVRKLGSPFLHQLTSHVCFSALINERKITREQLIFPLPDRGGSCNFALIIRHRLELRERRVFSVADAFSSHLFASVLLTSRRASHRALHASSPSFFFHLLPLTSDHC